ncbi:MAG: tRNA (adenosine(37)-N6)-threonylcarbamoyltransferase complex ATPase subunit type 1 TsaE [Acidimicrobiia bacterium]|nr:tRNA (adenosine(37)-N6)-threonylcarbamoyltransferase complex ATPase subunit type 1 TsaE [Acidimicrobiia bacterium]MCY4434252.1 tRNA (adenosine(37)-N6)-threonylcarbamoyltransferase complex ATPase subunit type 1 TsaE [bacterium]
MIRARSRSPEDTRKLAACLAELAQPGDLLLLVGDLGAGKTTFTQGFAAGLDIHEPVTSPTFTLAREYHGRLLLHHLDVFRLEQVSEVLDLGLPELLDSDGVTLIEWGDAIRQALPNDYLEVALTFVDGPINSPDERVVVLSPVGPRWQARSDALAAAIRQWIGEPPC